MISDIDDRLLDWASGVAPGAQVVLGFRDSSVDQLTVALYLYAIAHEPPARSWDRPPHQLWARYLVTVAAPSARDEHRVLGDLLVAALDEDDLQVETEPWSADQWRAAGSAPTPAFAISTLLRIDRPVAVAQPVLHDLEVRGVATADLEGLVVGPGDVPLVDVRVELVGAGAKATRTDKKGRFRLRAVPVLDAGRELVLTTKNRRLSVTAAPEEDTPLIIRLDPPGG